MEWTGPAAIGISAAASVISLMAWLEPGEASHLFQLIPTDNVPQPAQLRVEYDGMTAPVFLPVV